MPIPTGGLLEISLDQTFNGANITNVFHYHNALNLEPPALIGVAAAFNSTIVAPLSLVQHAGVTYVRVRVKTIFGTLPDIEVTPAVPTGTIAGNSSPSFLCFSYRLGVETKETKAGAKRFSGLIEENVLGNGYEGAYFSLLQTFAASLSVGINDGINTYEPVVASRPTVPRPNWVINYITLAAPNLLVTTQRSRKL